MKKRLTLILISILCLSVLCLLLSACNGDGGSDTVTVNFIVDGGAYTKAWTDAEGKVKLPEAPEKDGYTFAGWYLDEALTKEFNSSVVLKYEDGDSVYVYAKFDSLVTHNLTRYPAKAASCLTKGNIEYFKCRD